MIQREQMLQLVRSQVGVNFKCISGVWFVHFVKIWREFGMKTLFLLVFASHCSWCWQLLCCTSGHNHWAAAILPTYHPAWRLCGPQCLVRTGRRRWRRDIRVRHSRISQRQRGGHAQSELQLRGQHHSRDSWRCHTGKHSTGRRDFRRKRSPARRLWSFSPAQRLLPDHYRRTRLSGDTLRRSRTGQSECFKIVKFGLMSHRKE